MKDHYFLLVLRIKYLFLRVHLRNFFWSPISIIHFSNETLKSQKNEAIRNKPRKIELEKKNIKFEQTHFLLNLFCLQLHYNLLMVSPRDSIFQN